MCVQKKLKKHKKLVVWTGPTFFRVFETLGIYIFESIGELWPMINYSYITLHNTCYACEFQHVFCAFSFQTRHANQLTKSSIKRAAIKGNCIPSFLIKSRNHMKSKERKKQRFVIIYHVFIYFWHMKDIKKPIIAISILGWPVWYATHPEKNHVGIITSRRENICLLKSPDQTSFEATNVFCSRNGKMCCFFPNLRRSVNVVHTSLQASRIKYTWESTSKIYTGRPQQQRLINRLWLEVGHPIYSIYWVEALFSKPMAYWGTEITENLQAKPSGFSQQDGDCGLSVVKKNLWTRTSKKQPLNLKDLKSRLILEMIPISCDKMTSITSFGSWQKKALTFGSTQIKQRNGW